jgi:glycosyltransferase involved in cell wall biosynthesis
LANDLKRFELKNLALANAILSISNDDTAEFKKIGLKTKNVHIPVNIETVINETPASTNRIYHLGMMDWEPNRQAVSQLVDWMPELRNRNPLLELHIAGSKSEEFIQKDEENGIYVHGFVDSVDDFARNHGLLISPIRVASGVRVKFLEAMALGVPIVTTSLGALGVEHEKYSCLCIAETKEEFFTHIDELTTNSSMREEIGRNALNYIDKNHNIDIISQRIVEIFETNT